MGKQINYITLISADMLFQSVWGKRLTTLTAKG